MVIAASQPSAVTASYSGRGVVMGLPIDFHRSPRACEKLPPDTLIDSEVIILDQTGRCAFKCATA